MLDSHLPSAAVLAAIDTIQGLIEAAKPLLETHGIGDGDIAAALLELAEWYAPRQAAVVALVDEGGVWLRCPRQILIDTPEQPRAKKAS